MNMPHRSWLTTIMFVISAFFGVYGFIEFAGMMAAAKSAPQQAVACGAGLAYAAIPYCIARSIQLIIRGR